MVVNDLDQRAAEAVAADTGRWLHGMSRLQQRVEEKQGTARHEQAGKTKETA